MEQRSALAIFGALSIGNGFAPLKIMATMLCPPILWRRANSFWVIESPTRSR